jgi:autotransporter translocation and assembly factor TamB
MVDTVGTLDISARLPSLLQLDADPVFEFIDGVPVEGSLRAEQFGVTAVAAFFPELRDVVGVMDAEVNLTGTADAPVVDGALTLTRGAMTIAPLNQRYSEIAADIGFDGRRLVLRDVRARSDGWVVVGGQVVLERLDQPVVDLEIVFDGFRPIGVENQRDAAVFGTLAISGPPEELELTGSIRVDDGYVVIPQFGGPGADLIDITRPPPVIGQSVRPVADGGVMENLRIRDLRVTAGETAWFMAEDARVQLAGTLTINKIGESFPIVGTLDGTRGQYTLIAGPIVRRFDIVSAQVRFLGAPQPNPAIDITARRIVYDPGGRELAVDVRITGTLETPRLALAGAEMVDLAEAELLSLLLFGQPGFALGGDVLPGDALLEQTFLGGLAELAAIEVERSLAGLGFDIFQIRLGQGPLGGLGTPTVVVGRQLRPDVFITVETGIVALFGGGGAGEAPPNTWAVRLDWAFDPRSRLRLAYEPVIFGRGLRGAALALPLTPPRQQLLLELRRRWTY